MSNKIYLPNYKAMISTDKIQVMFWRLNMDIRDQMCDALEPEWEPQDDFIVKVKELVTETTTEVYDDCIVTRRTQEVTASKEFRFSGKDKANTIWSMARKGATLEQISQYIQG